MLAASGLLAGCSGPALLLGAAGVATDTSIPWAIAKHVHARLTEGDPVPCARLDTVQRALSMRCGPYEPGSLAARDVAHPGLEECALSVAAREPALWATLPELLDKGAQPEACARAPLLELARAHPCPDFAAASEPVRRAIAWLAEADARAVSHDAVRLLSCPNARAAGLDRVLDAWADAGALQPARTGFGVLGALHPDALDSPLARRLEAQGHTARAALGAYDGVLASGFEEALRTGHLAALDWWLARVPELARSVPPTQGDRQPWLPLARVLVPRFLQDPSTQGAVVAYLLAHGADPRARLPFDASLTVRSYARTLRSPQLALLEAADGPVASMAPRLASAQDGAGRVAPAVASTTTSLAGMPAARPARAAQALAVE